MKQFFKFVLATIVGVVLSGIVIILILAGIIGGLIASAGSEKTVDVEPNSVLHMAFTTPITERTPNNPLAGLGNTRSLGGRHRVARRHRVTLTVERCYRVGVPLAHPHTLQTHARARQCRHFDLPPRLWNYLVSSSISHLPTNVTACAWHSL